MSSCVRRLCVIKLKFIKNYKKESGSSLSPLLSSVSISVEHNMCTSEGDDKLAGRTAYNS